MIKALYVKPSKLGSRLWGLWLIGVAFAGAGVNCTEAASVAVAFGDSTFDPADYRVGFSYIADPANSISFSQCTSCGNPDQALQIEFRGPSNADAPVRRDFELGLINPAFTYTPSTQYGPIKTISASVDKNTFQNNPAHVISTFRPLIEQDGTFYAAEIPAGEYDGDGINFSGFVTASASALVAADFLEIDPVTGADVAGSHPNFAGDTMHFGLLQLDAGKARNPIESIQIYDNLHVTLSVPQPSTLSSISWSLVGLALFRRRKGPDLTRRYARFGAPGEVCNFAAASPVCDIRTREQKNATSATSRTTSPSATPRSRAAPTSITSPSSRW